MTLSVAVAEDDSTPESNAARYVMRTGSTMRPQFRPPDGGCCRTSSGPQFFLRCAELLTVCSAIWSWERTASRWYKFQRFPLLPQAFASQAFPHCSRRTHWQRCCSRNRTACVACASPGGEGGIRTPGTLPGTAVFKTACFNHSHTSPRCVFISLQRPSRIIGDGQGTPER